MRAHDWMPGTAVKVTRPLATMPGTLIWVSSHHLEDEFTPDRVEQHWGMSLMVFIRIDALTSVQVYYDPSWCEPATPIGQTPVQPHAGYSRGIGVAKGVAKSLPSGLSTAFQPESVREFDGFCDACSGFRQHRRGCPRAGSGR